MGSRSRVEAVFIIVCLVALWTWGCSQAVMMTHETDAGGVVMYLFSDDKGGPVGSPYRKEALNRIQTKCPSGYTIVKDGEVQGYTSLSGVEGSEGETRGRRWGLQFRCK